MSDDISGRGDPLKSLKLLWEGTEKPKRGPRQKVELGALVAAAIEIADTEGLGAVSTRRVAEKVGISPMSFYTYVPGKAELLDLMLDTVGGRDIGEVPEFEPAQWRSNLTLMAVGLRDFYLRHPWVLDLATHRPVLGPGTMTAYEFALRTVDGLGLSPVEMDLVVTTIGAFAIGAARPQAQAKKVREATGLTDDQWWYTIEPYLSTRDFSPWPVSQRIGPIVGELYGLGDPDMAFKFGMERLLDGFAVLIERNKGG
jgi:AcrR family transcriptional regulator